MLECFCLFQINSVILQSRCFLTLYWQYHYITSDYMKKYLVYCMFKLKVGSLCSQNYQYPLLIFKLQLYELLISFHD